MVPKSSSKADAARIVESLTAVNRQLSRPHARQSLDEATGVKLDKFSEIVLACLARPGQCDMRLADISTAMGIEPSTVTRKVQRLADAGLIERQSDPTDGRAFRLRLTNDGNDLVDSIADAKATLFSSAIAKWSASDRSEFVRLLERLADDLSHGTENPS